MSSDVIVKSLGEVASFISRGITPSYTEEKKVRVINQKCIRNNRINFELTRFTDPEKKKVSNEKLLKQFDILVNSTGVGTLGRVAQVKKLDSMITVDSHVTIVRPSTDIDPLFLGYSVYSQQNLIEAMGEGSTGQTELSRTRLAEEIKIRVPSKNEQLMIGKLFADLDNKIELNNAINKNLEEMAQALFKRWFVEFEFPNENGDPYKSSGGEFEESELGLIPKGWRVGVISDLGEVVGGATPSKGKEEYYTSQGIPWITPKDLSANKNKYISRGQIDITESGFKNSSTRLVPKGTVLFSSRAPIGYIAISKNEMTTNQGFKSVVPFEHIGSEFLFYLLKFNTEKIENRASGSTFKEISGSEMKRVPVIIPSIFAIQQFNGIVESLGELVGKCESENDTLILLRDTLLPKLMSGEIRVLQ